MHEAHMVLVCRDHVERLLNMLLEIRRLGAGDLVTKVRFFLLDKLKF